MLAAPFRNALALIVAAVLAASGMSAEAVELPAGTKNFTPPASTPNYFSNEVGAVQGNRSAGSMPIGHISGPRVGHAVVMSGTRGKPGKIVHLRRRGRGAAAHARVRRAATHHHAVSAHRHGKAARVPASSRSHDNQRRR